MRAMQPTTDTEQKTPHVPARHGLSNPQLPIHAPLWHGRQAARTETEAEPATPERTTRKGRPRSRQCRGKRARNYVRTLERAANTQVGQLIDDATATGALESFNRLRKRLEKSS